VSAPSDTRRDGDHLPPSPRQVELLSMRDAGLSTVAIAERLGLRPRTVVSELSKGRKRRHNPPPPPRTPRMPRDHVWCLSCGFHAVESTWRDQRCPACRAVHRRLFVEDHVDPARARRMTTEEMARQYEEGA